MQVHDRNQQTHVSTRKYCSSLTRDAFCDEVAVMRSHITLLLLPVFFLDDVESAVQVTAHQHAQRVRLSLPMTLMLSKPMCSGLQLQI